MKKCKYVLGSYLACIMFTQLPTQAKEFSNMDFEIAIQPLVPDGAFRVPIDKAMPGWTEYAGGVLYDKVIYNELSAGGGSISLQGPGSLQPILQGNYSVVMQGPSYVLGGSFALGQTGQVPVTAKSLQFWAYNLGGIEVSFDNHLLPYAAIEVGSEYTTYGADISQFTGQTGELKFTAPPQTGATLDNIRFSSEPIVVPEPGTISLFALGAFALAGRFVWRRS